MNLPQSHLGLRKAREHVWKRESVKGGCDHDPGNLAQALKPGSEANLDTIEGASEAEVLTNIAFLCWEDSMSWITSSRTLTGAKSKIAPLFNLTTMELSCMGGGRVNLSSIVHSSLLNSALASSKSASTFSTALGPSLAAPARTLFLT